MHLNSNDWDICALPEVIFEYRRHTINLSSNNSRLWDSRLKILRHYVPQGNVDAIILIDSELDKLGKSDYKFVGNATETYYINDGKFMNKHKKEGVESNISLTEFISKKFQRTGKTVISFNYNKISEIYFD